MKRSDNTQTVTPRVGMFAGQTVKTNHDGEGIFTRRPDGQWQQHTGTGQTPRFHSVKQLSAWLRKNYSTV